MQDKRHISTGREIPTERYSDQPYVVVTDDGAWLCTITTGAGIEGASGQHIIATRSRDQRTHLVSPRRGRTGRWTRSVIRRAAQSPQRPHLPLLQSQQR